MTTLGFVATHARDAKFERGLRAFFEYRELGHSPDLELLEIFMPADFGTREVDAVQPAAAGR